MAHFFRNNYDVSVLIESIYKTAVIWFIAKPRFVDKVEKLNFYIESLEVIKFWLIPVMLSVPLTSFSFLKSY